MLRLWLILVSLRSRGVGLPNSEDVFCLHMFAFGTISLPLCLTLVRWVVLREQLILVCFLSVCFFFSVGAGACGVALQFCKRSVFPTWAGVTYFNNNNNNNNNRYFKCIVQKVKIYFSIYSLPINRDKIENWIDVKIDLFPDKFHATQNSLV